MTIFLSILFSFLFTAIFQLYMLNDGKLGRSKFLFGPLYWALMLGLGFGLLTLLIIALFVKISILYTLSLFIVEGRLGFNVLLAMTVGLYIGLGILVRFRIRLLREQNQAILTTNHKSISRRG